MRKVPCDGPFPCRNIGTWDENGDHNLVGVKELVEVPDDQQGRVYCSVECLMYDSLRPPTGDGK